MANQKKTNSNHRPKYWTFLLFDQHTHRCKLPYLFGLRARNVWQEWDYTDVPPYIYQNTINLPFNTLTLLVFIKKKFEYFHISKYKSPFILNVTEYNLAKIILNIKIILREYYFKLWRKNVSSNQFRFCQYIIHTYFISIYKSLQKFRFIYSFYLIYIIMKIFSSI